MDRSILQVKAEGTLSWPPEMCERYGIEEGDLFTLIDLDGAFVLAPKVGIAPTLVRDGTPP